MNNHTHKVYNAATDQLPGNALKDYFLFGSSGTYVAVNGFTVNLFSSGRWSYWLPSARSLGAANISVNQDIHDLLEDIAVVAFSLPLGEIGTGSVLARGDGEALQTSFDSFYDFKKVYGDADPGDAWHHIVEQNPGNIASFGNRAIHNTENLMQLEHGARSIHARISGFYSSKTTIY